MHCLGNLAADVEGNTHSTLGFWHEEFHNNQEEADPGTYLSLSPSVSLSLVLKKCLHTVGTNYTSSVEEYRKQGYLRSSESFQCSCILPLFPNMLDKF